MFYKEHVLFRQDEFIHIFVGPTETERALLRANWFYKEHVIFRYDKFMPHTFL